MIIAAYNKDNKLSITLYLKGIRGHPTSNIEPFFLYMFLALPLIFAGVYIGSMYLHIFSQSVLPLFLNSSIPMQINLNGHRHFFIVLSTHLAI